MATIITSLTEDQLTDLVEDITGVDLVVANSDEEIVLDLIYSEDPLADRLILTGSGLSFAGGVLTSGEITGLEFKQSDNSLALITGLQLSYSGLNTLLSDGTAFEQYLEHLLGDDGDDDSGDDDVFGSDDDDSIDSDDGDDYIKAGSGDDDVSGGSGNDDLYGDDGDDDLSGDDGDDQIFGGSGDDDLYGGSGDDHIDGGAGIDDTVHYEGLRKVSLDLSTGLARSGRDRDQLLNIENAIGSARSDHITGDDNSNKLYGEDGNDHLKGGLGDDLLEGDSGNDKLRGDDGDDEIAGGSGNDNIAGGIGDDSVSGGTGNDKINGDDGDDSILGDDGNDTIFAGSGNDVINGGTGKDNIKAGEGDDQIDGGAGADNMAGGFGDDTYYVDDAKDKVTEKAEQGEDTVVSTLSFSIEKRANLENITLNGTDNTNATGNAGSNVLIGNIGNNILDGKAGNDVLIGGAGDDTLIGGHGLDVFRFADLNLGIDTVNDFTQGEDQLDLSAIGSFVLVEGGFDTAGGAPAFQVYFDNGVLYGSADGGQSQAFEIELLGVTSVSSSDFFGMS